MSCMSYTSLLLALIDGIRPRSWDSCCSDETTPAIPAKTMADLNGGLQCISITPSPRHGAVIRSEIPIPINLVHRYPHLKRAVDLAVLHQIPPHNTIVILALVDVFGQVELNPAQEILFSMRPCRELLYDLKQELAFLECLVSVNGEADLLGLFVVPAGAVVEDDAFIRVSVVLCHTG